jgi:Polyketide cyclase / dehydrase and lipid transport
MHDEVTIHMKAPADKIWDLVSDVTKIGRYSPETFEAVWMDGATGPVVGARFRGHVKRNEKGPIYWTTCTVRVSEPAKEFTFGVGNTDKPLNIWSYKLSPSGDGTDVTESFQLADKAVFRLYWAVLGKLRGKRNHNDMLRTLERIKAEVE